MGMLVTLNEVVAHRTSLRQRLLARKPSMSKARCNVVYLAHDGQHVRYIAKNTSAS
jgi:hypothetical protein